MGKKMTKGSAKQETKDNDKDELGARQDKRRMDHDKKDPGAVHY